MRIKQKKGISLIVLVITIIVIIILATAIILSLQSSGIIGKANDAKNKSDVANAKQVVTIAKAEWKLMTFEKREDEGTFKEYAENKLVEAGYQVGIEGDIIVSENGDINIVYIGEDNKKAIIPEGFTVSKVNTEDTVTEGFVIYEGNEPVTAANVTLAQKTRNQFVWIPVDNMDEFIRKDGYSYGGLQDSVAEGEATEPSSYDENTNSQYSTEVEEYNAMKKSVEKYGGFYVARYEAGDETTKKVRTSYTSEPHKVVSKKGAWVYNYVGWGSSMTEVSNDIIVDGKNKGKGAVYLSQNMYPKNDNFTTNLIYGVQWDAIINYLKSVDNLNVEGKKYIADSTGMGWYSNTPGSSNYKTGTDVDSYASNKVKNIYDLAGSVFEWTMEAHNTDLRVIRGGSCARSSGNAPASVRNGLVPTTTDLYYGFRVTLYFK